MTSSDNRSTARRSGAWAMLPALHDRVDSAPRAWVEVDLNRLCANFTAIRAHVGSHVQVIAVVKANAYGHGVAQVAEALLASDCGGPERFAVATAREAVALRDIVADRPIHILGPLLELEIPLVVRHGITPSVHSIREVTLLAEAAAQARRQVNVHVHLDTGMGRMGCRTDALPDLVDAIATQPYLRFEGLSSHYAEADKTGPGFTHQQTRVLLHAASVLRRRGMAPECLHIGNSAGMALHPNPRLSAVRPGLALYGHGPSPAVAARLSLKPVLTWKTRIAMIKELDAGASIGYARTHRVGRRSRIASLSVGYADGYRRSLSNNADVLIHGRRAPVVGRVSMDMVNVNIDHLPDAKVGDEVVLVGRQGRAEIRAEEMATRMATTTYELFCGISHRVQRVYRHQRSLDGRIDETYRQSA